MMITVFFWLITAFVFLILEAGNPNLFFFLSFCLSSLLSALLAYTEFSLSAQCIIFLIGSCVAFGALNLFIKRAQHTDTRTNAYALEGQRALVTEAITPPATGQVRVNGEIWTARSLHDESFSAGTVVLVVQVRGAHLIIKSID